MEDTKSDVDDRADIIVNYAIQFVQQLSDEAVANSLFPYSASHSKLAQQSRTDHEFMKKIVVDNYLMLLVGK